MIAKFKAMNTGARSGLYPYPGECLTSFLGRVACMSNRSGPSLLQELINSDQSVQRPIAFEDIDFSIGEDLCRLLNDRLDPSRRRIGSLVMSVVRPGLNGRWMRRVGGVETGDGRIGGAPQPAWCPRCLMVDQLDGRHQYFRLSWLLATRTFCSIHKLPLTTHCLGCHDRAASPRFVWSGDTIVLACSRCGSTYSSQLGLPDMSNSTALQIRKNRLVQKAWRGAILAEAALERSLRSTSRKKHKNEFRDFFISFANILMGAHEGGIAPIELFTSPAYPARPNPRNVVTMASPYLASSISVRRKTHGLLAALLKNKANLFSIKGVYEQRWGREPTMQQLRLELEPEQNDALDQLLLRFPAKWF